MISINDHLTVEQFSKKTSMWLEKKEAENNLFLGIVSNLLSKPPDQRQPHYLLAVEEGGRILGAGVCTPPYKLAITAMPDTALPPLADHLLTKASFAPGLSGPKQTVAHLVEIWKKKSGKNTSIETSLRLYQLTKVEAPKPAPGKMRLCTPADLDLIADWITKFHGEIKAVEKKDYRKQAEGFIQEQRLFVWEDGKAVSIAGFQGLTAHGVRVGLVYTSSSFRGKGYASSLVAAVSQRLLDSGRKFCVLYTDLSNPTSNSIYQKIGYHPVCDWDVYSFR